MTLRHTVRATMGLLAFVITALPAWGQTATPQAQSDQPESADDPTRAVFFSMRSEYFNLLADVWTDALILRSDRVLLRTHNRLGGRVGLLTRVDVPMLASNAGGATRAGLGDLYLQAAHVPWLTRHFALAMGTGVTFPTATDRVLGEGKWQLAPILAPIWFFPGRRGFVLLRLHEHVSFAGDPSRQDVNYLEIIPSILYNFKKGWWMLFDSEVETDWHDQNRISFRSGAELGHVVWSRVGLSVKPEIPWGSNRTGDWTVKVVLTRYRQP